MSTKAWLNWEKGIFYEIARDRHEILYFDERCWSHSEIEYFFDDLKYGDYETYIKTIRRFPEYKATDSKVLMTKTKNAETRYKKWKKNHPSLREWMD